MLSYLNAVQQTPQSEKPTELRSFSSTPSACSGSSQVLSPTLSQPGPSCLSEVTSPHPRETQNVDTLLSLFSSRFTAKQIQSLYRYSGDDFDNAIECLMNGPSLECIVRMINFRTMSYPVVKVAVDSDNVWADMLALYKQSHDLIVKRIWVTLDNSPVIDICGVRKHVDTSVFADFVSNMHVCLFDGPPNSVSPCYSAEARCCGLFKVLGIMVGHSIWDRVSLPLSSIFLVHCVWGGGGMLILPMLVETLPMLSQRYSCACRE